MQRHADFDYLASQRGIVLPMAMDYMPDNIGTNPQLAMDAQPALVTVGNSGIPAFLTTFVDSRLIEVLVTPMKAAQIIGEAKKGDWTTRTTMFPVAESAGEVSSYGDYNGNGQVTANVNWPQRQSYGYQTVTSWGEKELADMGVARIDWANRLSISSVMIMNKFQNKSYFSGIAGLQNYGLLNDPSLITPVVPGTKAAGGGNTWLAGTGLEIFVDIETLVTNLIAQTGGLVEMTDEMVLCISPGRAVALTKVTQYNVNVMDMIKKNFPGMRIETAVEYTTASGELGQLIAPSINGQQTAEANFTEKLRAHTVVQDLSSYKQKKSGGTWGAVIYQPMGIAQMLGI